MDSKIKKLIEVNLQVEGIHRWKDCNIADVDYLKEYHRHIFHITANKAVRHNERDIEIIQFKRSIQSFLSFKFSQMNGVLFFDNMSCESIAELIAREFKCSMVKVLEDNENGAIIIL